MAKKTIVEVQIDKAIVPLHIIQEMRASVRIAIGRKYATLRVPYLMTPTQKKKQTERAINWIEDALKKDVRIYNRFEVKKYETGDTIRYFGEEYLLHINDSESSQKAKIKGNTITMDIVFDQSKAEIQKACQTLLSRVLAKRVKEKFSEIVYRLNDLHFKKEINAIRLKNNRSNWGSCSGKSNLNFSTRLLFAPQEVIEYVVIHELAHLIEMNHSNRFWTLVAKACPSYKLSEKWLKVNGHTCDF